jgi:hypothetical protein
MADPVPTPSDPSPANPAPVPPPVDPTLAPAPVPDPIHEPTPTPIPDSAPEPDKGIWPEDWREKYVEQHGGDPKLLKRLQRYASPQAAFDALFAAQAKISSGQISTPLKPDATPEEKAEWREVNGIPAKPEDYKVTLPNGLVFAERDKPTVDAFLQRAHEQNYTPAQVNDALGFYAEQQERAEQDLLANDLGTQQACEDILREEYGPEYRRNLQAASELLAGVPGDIKDKLLNGRLEDGTPIGNSPEVIRWLVGLARELNPIGTVVPGSGSNAVQALESEMDGLRKMMGDYKSEYWKGPNSQKHQARYKELLEAKQKGRV